MTLLKPFGYMQSGGGQLYDTISIVDAAQITTDNAGTMTFTVSADAEILIVLGMGGRYQFSGTVGAMGVSWQGDTFTPLAETAISPDVAPATQVSTGRAGFFYRLNPTVASAQTLTFSMTNSTVRKAIALTLKGIDTADPFSQVYSLQKDTNTGDENNEVEGSYTPINGAWVLDLYGQYTGAAGSGFAAASGQTSLGAGATGDGGGNRHGHLMGGYLISTGSAITSRYTATTGGSERVSSYIGTVINPKPL